MNPAILKITVVSPSGLTECEHLRLGIPDPQRAHKAAEAARSFIVDLLKPQQARTAEEEIIASLFGGGA